MRVLSSLRFDTGLTHLHRLSGLPSVWGSCTIASLADATAANLTALAWHSPGQLDHVASQGFTPGQGNLLPNIDPVGFFRARPHILPLDWASSTDDYQQRYAGRLFDR
jgi:hypothetical protein